MSFLTSAFEFFIRSLLDLANFIFICRFILQLVRADFHNPLSQAVYNATNPVLQIFRPYITSKGDIDFACGLIIGLISLLKITLLSLLSFHHMPHLVGLLLWVSGDIINAVLYFYFFTILSQLLVNWMHPAHAPVLNRVLLAITQPITRPVQARIKPIQGYDIGIFVVLIVLQMALMSVGSPLVKMGMALAMH